jgi:LuxR family maltose regulon positive regulatory protein
MATATPLLATKLYIPPPRPKIVLRPRLLKQWNDVLNHKLTLISAPAGFGKSTLVSEWIHKKDAMQVAWLSLDDGETTLFAF